MRSWLTGVAVLLFGVVGAASAGEPLSGRWKLVVLAFGSDDFAIVDFKKDMTDIVHVQKFLGDTKIDAVESKDKAVKILFNFAGQSSPFKGTLDGDKALGAIQFRGSYYPARLEKTDADTAKLGDQALLRSILAAQQQAAKDIGQLTAVIHANKGNPTLYHAYENLLKMAEKAKLSNADVKKYAAQWLEEAKPYGPWSDECQVKALAALVGQDRYAGLAMELAQQAEKDLKDAAIETRSQVAGTLAWAAGVSGNAAVATAAQARHDALERQLDEAYHKAVPPFSPEKFAGRKDPKNNRVVLMELFTGAQCPPCVGPDVAFDGLLKTYQPKELIALQYHLHIPGPDPLTNADTEARAEYYDVSSTPTPFMNGKSSAPGGGGMGQSEAKYHEYRGVIDNLLEGPAGAAITLEASQVGDSIAINATADARQDEKAKLSLRFVVTEESIQYVGSNKIRFHHNVVRAMPGGADGTPLDKGSCTVQLKIGLENIRKGLNEYLDQYAAQSPFPRPRPAIELRGLSVVAFVQNDDTKEVLHAVTARVAK